ncbi:MAG: phosphoribosylanthranilate isomerase [Chloroflexi bacterium]|nr:phosphoribosylanthranilate isomerase [Chloroflexota bacterium]
MKVKICGVTTLEDALFAARSGADMIGFNFWPRSKRYIATAAAAELCDRLRSHLGDTCPALVGVFVNAVVSDISRVMDVVGLDYAQLSGDESDSVLRELRGIAFKGIRPATLAQAEEDYSYFAPVMPDDPDMPSLLVDASVSGEYGGTGQQAADEIVRWLVGKAPRLLLAGGLTPATVVERVRAFHPWGVDVASGVEGDLPGIKDAHKVAAFIAAARSAA